MANSKHENIYNIIGKNIKKYRIKKGLTQRALADKLLLSESFIAKLESITYQSISIDTLEQIANALDTNIINLFYEDEKKETSEKELQSIS